MCIKLIGAFLLSVGGVGLGRYIGMYLKLRQRELERFKNVLMLIYSDTEFGKSCLADSCIRAAKNTSGAAKNVIESFADRLNQSTSDEVGDMWRQAVTDNKGLYLTDEDLTHLADLGNGIGSADYTLQLSAIKSVILYIEDKCKHISGESGARLRLCQSTGLMLGLLIAVLLF
jgi:stage III sporulation protein AB